MYKTQEMDRNLMKPYESMQKQSKSLNSLESVWIRPNRFESVILCRTSLVRIHERQICYLQVLRKPGEDMHATCIYLCFLFNAYEKHIPLEALRLNLSRHMWMHCLLGHTCIFSWAHKRLQHMQIKCKESSHHHVFCQTMLTNQAHLTDVSDCCDLVWMAKTV